MCNKLGKMKAVLDANMVYWPRQVQVTVMFFFSYLKIIRKYLMLIVLLMSPEKLLW